MASKNGEKTKKYESLGPLVMRFVGVPAAAQICGVLNLTCLRCRPLTLGDL